MHNLQTAAYVLSPLVSRSVRLLFSTPMSQTASRHLRHRLPTRHALPYAIAVAGFLLASCSGSVPMPSSDVSSGQAIMDLGNAMGQLREENALLQADIDSLRGVVAYQDSIVRQLAAMSNLSMRPVSAPFP